MLIPIIIPPQDGELMYSWMARLAVANGFDGTEASAFRLFSKTYIHPNTVRGGAYEPHYDCHDDVGNFLLSAYPLDKLAQMYVDTNIYTGIAPFMNQMRQTNYIVRSVYPNDIGFDTLIHKYGNAYINNAYICPECAKEDLKNHGFYYLHREHHLPGIKCCHKHHCSLMKYGGVHSHELDSIDLYKKQNISITLADIRYAEFYRDFLYSETTSSPENIALAIRMKLNDIGYLKPDYQKFVDKVVHDGFGGLFSKDLKAYMDLRLSGMRGSNFDFTMIVGLMCCLFDSVNDLLSILETDNGIRDRFYENILEYDYSLIGKYNSSVVVLKNNKTDNIFMTHPYAFNIGWVDPEYVSSLNECSMYKILVSNISNGDYSVISEFTSTDDDIMLRHNVCGREYKVRAGSFLISNNRCICEKNLTAERAQKRLDNSSNGEYELIDYKNQHEDATFIHRPCGTKIIKMYFVQQRNPTCPICTPKIKAAARDKQLRELEARRLAEKQKKQEVSGRVVKGLYSRGVHDSEFFRKQMKALVGDEYKLVGTFDTIRDRTEMYHENCGSTFIMSPAAFISGRRCRCCEMLKGKDFEEYVDYTTNGTYMVDSHYSDKCGKMRIVNTRDKTSKILPKCKVAQELYRPTVSPVLPCTDRRMDRSPYVEPQTTVIFKSLKQQFGVKDIFTFADMNLSETGLNEKQIRAAITNLIENARLHVVDKGCYCLTDYKHKPHELAYYRFCERNGHRIGVFRSGSLCLMLSGNMDADRYFVRSNIGSSYKNHRARIVDIIVADLLSPIVISDDNVQVVQMIEYAKLPTKDASPYYEQLRKYAEENGITYPMCAEMALRYSNQFRLIDSGLQRIFGMITPDGHVDRVSEDLHDRLYKAIVDGMPDSGVMTKKEIVAQGFNSTCIVRALKQLVNEGLIIRTAIGRYALSSNKNATPMAVPDKNQINDEDFIAWLHENYDRIIITPENITYKGYDTKYIRTVLCRYATNGILKRIGKGLYMTADTEISTKEALSLKYLYGEGHKHIGYRTWQSFEYDIGLRDQEPTNEYVMSNLRLNCARRHSLKIHRGDSEILVRSPKYEITDDNYKILPLLDFLVKLSDKTPNALDAAKRYLKENRITYEDCKPYLDNYRDIVGTRIRIIFGIE